ncbi:hypothetical protein K466DRAFT_606616 [Polyporus arcularius HHB13444]|uniref:Uncharacterized protein n=1 Tax=Polyporus arcularius HHB13444 TaxID=1314778 RepID=A0A5C3NQI7_9APHY|nr:hypothetical protein K466DRAFT_606616 [Polyporus arcularius HHB13444]
MECSAEQGLLVPSLSPFHKTRSGLGFSPWTTNIGTPLHAPDDFDVEQRIQAVLAESRAASEAGSPSDYPPDPDDLPTEPSPEPSTRQVTQIFLL